MKQKIMLVAICTDLLSFPTVALADHDRSGKNYRARDHHYGHHYGHQRPAFSYGGQFNGRHSQHYYSDRFHQRDYDRHHRHYLQYHRHGAAHRHHHDDNDYLEWMAFVLLMDNILDYGERD